MLDESFVALALGLSLFTAFAAEPHLGLPAGEPRIVSIADLPAAAPDAAMPDAAAPDLTLLQTWVATP